MLVLGPAGERSIFDERLLRLVDGCSSFDTLDGHAARISQQLKLPESAGEPLLRDLRHLISIGVLAKWSEVVGSGDGTLDPKVRITSFAILTRNRTKAVERCISSHLDHASRWGRSLELTVVDSSTDEEVGNISAMVERALPAAAAPVTVIDRGRRRRYAERLAAAAGVALKTVLFGLEDGHGCGHDTGANRNLLTLIHAGRCFLSSDDDVVCEPRARPGGSDTLRVSTAADPTKLALHATAEETRAQVPLADRDLLADHEALLGARLRNLMAEHGPDGAHVEDLRGELVDALVSHDARIAVTSSGLAGDSGSSFPAFYLFGTGDQLRDQVAGKDVNAYRNLVESRQVSRLAGSPTVTVGPFLMSTHVAFDARSLLPPFFPVLRGQDLLFGRTLRTAMEGSLIGHVPTATWHEPAEGRRNSADQLWPPDPTPTVAVLLHACLNILAPSLVVARGAARLRTLGRQMTELGRLRPPDLRFVLEEEIIKGASGRVQMLSEALARLTTREQQKQQAADPWIRDFARYVDWQREGSARMNVLRPSDLSKRLSPERAEELVPLLLQGFGDLLQSWPALMDAARRIRPDEV